MTEEYFEKYRMEMVEDIGDVIDAYTEEELIELEAQATAEGL